VPVSTGRLKAVPDFLRVAAGGESKAADAAVFSNQIGEPIRYFERRRGELPARQPVL
jgi:hypothetical protein